jgi:hypothetical protein
MCEVCASSGTVHRCCAAGWSSRRDGYAFVIDHHRMIHRCRGARVHHEPITGEDHNAWAVLDAPATDDDHGSCAVCMIVAFELDVPGNAACT